jgi:hypothetical protein
VAASAGAGIEPGTMTVAKANAARKKSLAVFAVLVELRAAGFITHYLPICGSSFRGEKDSRIASRTR